MSLRVVADKRVWTAIVDLLTVGLDTAPAIFKPDELWARNLCFLNKSEYELRAPSYVFREYECPTEVYVELDRRPAKRVLKEAKGDVTLRVEGKELKFGEEVVGSVIKPEEYKIPKTPTPKWVNQIIDDAVRLRVFLSNAGEACEAEYDRYVGISCIRGKGVRVAAFDVSEKEVGKTWIEYAPYGWEITASATSLYDLNVLEAHLPPSATPIVQPQPYESMPITIYTADVDTYPLYVETENLHPLGVEYKFWVAPSSPLEVKVEDFAKRAWAEKPTPDFYAEMHYDKAPAFFDLVYSNTEEPEILFERTSIAAKNMDAGHSTYSDVKAEEALFRSFKPPPEPRFFRLKKERKRVKALLSIAALLEKNPTLKAVGGQIYLDDSIIGEAEPEKKAFEAGEVDIKLKNTLDVDRKQLHSLLRDMTTGRERRKEIPAAFVALAYDPTWEYPKLIFTDYEVYEEVEVKPREKKLVERFLSAYDIRFVRMFLPPSALQSEAPVTLGVEPFNLLLISYEAASGCRFRGYIAPRLDRAVSVAGRLGWLKPLTEEVVVEFVKARSPNLVTEEEMRETLLKQLYDVKPLEEIIKGLVKKGVLAEERKGWLTFYRLAEVTPKLKPLTEEAVLEKIRRLCEELDTDAVGFGELEEELTKDLYETKPLGDILRGLLKKGLVEVKSWPGRRIGGYRVEMRGFWSIKPTEPEEAVKKAEEVKLKPLTKEAVLSTIEKLNDEAGENVKFDDVQKRLVDEGYDTTELSKLIDELWKVDNSIRITLDGRIISKAYEEKVKPKPPPTPPGYKRVHFKRDMVRYIGMDRKYYGPFKACEEAVIEEAFAEAFRRHGFAEIVEGAASTPKAEAPEEGAESWEEAKKRYEKWRVESSPAPKTEGSPHNNPNEFERIRALFKVV